MKNNIFADFLEEKYSKENNYNKVILKSKEERVMKKRKILSFVAVFLVIVMVGIITPTIYAKINWNIEFKEYQYIPREEAKGNLDEIRESDYAQVLNMDYLVQDGIGVKVDKMLLTEDCFDAEITFKFPENVEINSQTFDFGYAVYDENNNIYDVSSRFNVEMKKGDRDYTIPFLCEELGVKYNKWNVYETLLNDSASKSLVSANKEDKTITKGITIFSKDAFPKSEKLYIRVFDLGYNMMDINVEERKIIAKENFNVSNVVWIFEIDIPEKFYNNKTLELKTLEDIPGLDLNKVTLTEACLVVRFNSKEYNELVEKAKDDNNLSEIVNGTIKIVDGEGKEYQNIRSSSGKEGSKIRFDVGKKDLAKKLYLKYTVGGKEYTSELGEK